MVSDNNGSAFTATWGIEIEHSFKYKLNLEAL